MKLNHISSTEIILKKLEGKWWEIEEDLIICCRLDVGVMYVTLKKGFQTDLGSVPKFAQSWINRANDNTLPFLLHDAGYTYGGFARHTWDKLLLDGLRLKGMSWFKAQCVHKAVSWFGESNFDNADVKKQMRVRLTWGHK